MKGKIKSIGLMMAAFLLTRCANVVSPTGGPKDVTPPKVVEARPANHGTGFDGHKIEITFDEYVVLNNASQQVLVSPPLATKPDVKLSGKTVSVKFKEKLKPNTTYTIDFGEAVKDLHEGNLFKDYRYSFSTGEVIDTLTLTGKVLHAEDKKPAAALFVGLYAEADSLDKVSGDSLFFQPLCRMPDFVAKTDKEGAFSFHGLPDRRFLVFALEDMNANLYYDLPNEKVAFLDTLVAPTDSVSLTLYAFIEVDTNQMLLEHKLVEEGLLRFAFRWPADSVAIDLDWPSVDSFQVVQVWSARHDTLNCWFTPHVLDSVGVHIHLDTFINIEQRYNLQFRESPSRNHAQAKVLKISDNLKNKMLLPGDDLLLRFPEPVVSIRMHDTSMLVAGSDTLINRMRFEPLDESGMAYRLAMPLSDTLDYVLRMAESIFYSVRGRTNEAFTLRFKRAVASDLGDIFVTIAPPEGHQVVVQLLDKKDHLLDTRVVDSTTRVGFTKLVPDKYKLRAIIDTDRNGRWSPGNFHRRFLPETVIPYKDELDLKAGWNIDLDDLWKIQPFSNF